MAARAQRRWLEPAELDLNEGERRARYERRQRELSRGESAREGRLGPQEFDALGFPIPQPIPAFMKRVRRLIDGD